MKKLTVIPSETQNNVAEVVSDATGFLNDLKVILADQTLSDTEKYGEVCLLVDAFDMMDVQERIHRENWYEQQIAVLLFELQLIDIELTSLQARNALVKPTSVETIATRRIRELELEQKPLQIKLIEYQSKLTKEKQCK